MRTVHWILAVVVLSALALAPTVARADSSSPALELHLDSLGSGTTPDSSPNNLTATAQGTLVTDGRFDNALRLSSAGDSVNVANNPVLAPAQLTVMAWVRQSGWGFDQFLVGKPYPVAGCNTDSYALTSGLESGVRFIVDVNGAQGPRQYATPESATSSVWDGQWHAIAGTFDGNMISLYQDGALVGSTPVNGSPLIYDTEAGDAGLAGLYAGLPSNPNNCSFSQQYSGDIDEIRVYDRALSAQEIADLQAPSATTPPELNMTPPTVVAAAADGLSTQGATLHGTVTPNGSTVSDCHFEYGTSTAYGASVPCAETVGGGTTGVPVSASVSGLGPGTTFDFKLVATNGGGTSQDTGTFATAAIQMPTPPAPVVTGVAPDTAITSGPTDATWDSTPTFTFTSTIAGSSFQCRIDTAAFAPCASPLTTSALGSGSHSLEVEAVSPTGVVDPTPAQADFSVAAVETDTYQCQVQPFSPYKSRGCSVEPTGQPCSNVYPTCDSATSPCPVGAECTLRTEVDWADDDNHGDTNTAGITWTAWISAQSNPPPASGGPTQEGPLVAAAECETAQGPGPGQCSASASGQEIGGGAAPYLACRVLGIDPNGDQSLFGPDSARSLTCTLTIQIEAAPSLAVATLGTAVAVLAPGAGTLGITPAGTSADVVTAAVTRVRKPSRPQPEFAPQRRKVRAAGPVTFKLALNRSAAKILTKRKKLTLSLHLKFTPAHGRSQSRTVRLTLRSLPKLPPKKRERAARGVTAITP